MVDFIQNSTNEISQQIKESNIKIPLELKNPLRYDQKGGPSPFFGEADTHESLMNTKDRQALKLSLESLKYMDYSSGGTNSTLQKVG